MYDILVVVGGYTSLNSASKVYERLSKQYSEVTTKIHYFKFPGRGQRNTPVCNKQTALEIIGLLPGVVGAKYRREAAKLFLQFLEVPEEVAKQAILKLVDQEKLDEVEDSTKKQRKYLQSYHGFMDILSEFGCVDIHYACVNRANNNLVDISGTRVNTMTERQRDELSVIQIMQRIRMEDEQEKIKSTKRPDWEAVDVSHIQGAKTLSHIRGCSEQDALDKIELSSKVEKWKRPQLNKKLKESSQI